MSSDGSEPSYILHESPVYNSPWVKDAPKGGVLSNSGLIRAWACASDFSTVGGDYLLLARQLGLSGKLGDYEWKTYVEIKELRDQVGSALMQLGCHQNDRIGIFAKTQTLHTVVDLACQAYGLISVPLYATLGLSNIPYIINHSNCRVIFASQENLPIVMQCLPLCPNLLAIIHFAELDDKKDLSQNASETPLLRRPVDDMDCLLDTYDPTNPATHVEVLPEQRPHPDIEHLDRGLRRTHDACAVFMFIPNGIDVTPGCSKVADVRVYSIHQFCDWGKRNLQPARRPRPEDIFSIMYTSGTTGTPKGVIMTHANPQATLAAGFVSGFDGFSPKDVYFAYLPLAHVFERLAELAAMRNGARIGFYSGDTKEVINDINFLKPTIFVGVPRILNRIYDLFQEGIAKMSFLKRVLFNRAYAAKLKAQHKSLSIKLRDCPEMKYFVSDTPPRGEILMRGPAVFHGYYRDPAMSREAFTADGWLKSGDVGSMLPNGCLRVIDRVKNIFKLEQGEYVAPEYLETVYKQCPFVQQIFIHGLPTKRYVTALVVPAGPHLNEWAAAHLPQSKNMSYEALLQLPEINKLIMDGLRAQAKASHLNHYEIPEAIALLAAPFPDEFVTPSMKLRRVPLRDHYAPILDALYDKKRPATFAAGAAVPAAAPASSPAPSSTPSPSPAPAPTPAASSPTPAPVSAPAAPTLAAADTPAPAHAEAVPAPAPAPAVQPTSPAVSTPSDSPAAAPPAPVPAPAEPLPTVAALDIGAAASSAEPTTVAVPATPTVTSSASASPTPAEAAPAPAVTASSAEATATASAATSTAANHSTDAVETAEPVIAAPTSTDVDAGAPAATAASSLPTQAEPASETVALTSDATASPAPAQPVPSPEPVVQPDAPAAVTAPESATSTAGAPPEEATTEKTIA